MYHTTPPRRGPYSANPVTSLAHAHAPLTLRPNKGQHTYDLRILRIPFHRGGPGVTGARQVTGTPRPRHPQTRNQGHTETQTAPQLAQHIAPKLTLHTRKRRKLNLTHSPNLAPIAPVYLNNCSAHHHPKLSHSANTSKPNRASQGFQNTAFPSRSNFQGHPGLSRVEGHPPGPSSSRRPPRLITNRKATPAYLRSDATLAHYRLHPLLSRALS